MPLESPPEIRPQQSSCTRWFVWECRREFRIGSNRSPDRPEGWPRATVPVLVLVLVLVLVPVLVLVLVPVQVLVLVLVLVRRSALGMTL